MSYCTTTDILGMIAEDVLIQLTDDNGLGVVDEAKVSVAIARADAVIDGYCAKRYGVPFSPVPALVRDLSVDMAIYHLYANRQGAPEDRKQRYDDAIAYLKDVSRGLVTLGPDADAETTGEASDNMAEISSSPRIFTRGQLKGF